MALGANFSPFTGITCPKVAEYFTEEGAPATNFTVVGVGAGASETTEMVARAIPAPSEA